jgi:hypothetical protein
VKLGSESPTSMSLAEVFPRGVNFQLPSGQETEVGAHGRGPRGSGWNTGVWLPCSLAAHGSCL